ncbi:hypothetical protein C8R45DRAFT_940288, partial [Mycena sanguinolenta]
MPYIKTYRLPTPLVVFQTALIGGPFLAGFLVAPFFVLSRHAVQTPIRRQRYQSPTDVLRTRKILAASAARGVLLVVFGPLGLWTRWCLGNRDPWVWALRWVLGRRKRIALLGYWGALGSVEKRRWDGGCGEGELGIWDGWRGTRFITRNGGLAASASSLNGMRDVPGAEQLKVNDTQRQPRNREDES